MNRIVSMCALIALGSTMLTACTDRRGSSEPGAVIPAGDGGAVDPRCWDPSSIVPDITCGSPMPDVVCPGSCAQTLDGIVGVGLSSCRCMDTGSGLGGQWICDTTACDAASDGGVTGTDAGVRSSDASVADAGGSCPPATVPPPTTATCTTTQYSQIRSIISQADYEAFAANPSNAECMGCLAQFALACGTENGCAPAAGDVFCCLDDACGDNDACRSMAIGGTCASQTDTLNRCVAAIPYCGLNPDAPPDVCFP